MSADEKYFGIVSKELSIGRMDEALWTKAFALENGQESATKARYIRLRVEQLQAADRSLQDSDESQEIAGANQPTQKAEISSGMLWGRYWAKAIDVSLVELTAIFGALAVHSAESNYWIVMLSMFLVGYVTYETLSLHFFQTSLGRLLFGIKVVPVDGASLSDILGRTLWLIFSGLGGFLPIVSLVTQVVAYRRVRRTGEAGWDAGKFAVLYGPDKGWKYRFAALFGLLLMLTANTFLSTVDKLVDRRNASPTSHDQMPATPTTGIVDPFDTKRPPVSGNLPGSSGIAEDKTASVPSKEQRGVLTLICIGSVNVYDEGWELKRPMDDGDKASLKVSVDFNNSTMEFLLPHTGTVTAPLSTTDDVYVGWATFRRQVLGRQLEKVMFQVNRLTEEGFALYEFSAGSGYVAFSGKCKPVTPKF